MLYRGREMRLRLRTLGLSSDPGPGTRPTGGEPGPGSHRSLASHCFICIFPLSLPLSSFTPTPHNAKNVRSSPIEQFFSVTKRQTNGTVCWDIPLIVSELNEWGYFNLFYIRSRLKIFNSQLENDDNISMQCKARLAAVGGGTCLYKIELSSHHFIIKRRPRTHTRTLFIDTKLANRKLFQPQ